MAITNPANLRNIVAPPKLMLTSSDAPRAPRHVVPTVLRWAGRLDFVLTESMIGVIGRQTGPRYRPKDWDLRTTSVRLYNRMTLRSTATPHLPLGPSEKSVDRQGRNEIEK